MKDKQMEYVIQKIRENEEKTQELTTVLEGFNHTFERLVGNVGKLVDSGNLDKTIKHVKNLDNHIGEVGQNVKDHDTRHQNLLEEMVKLLANMSTVITNDYKGGGDQEAPAAYSSLSVSIDKAIYFLDESSKDIVAYDLEKDGWEVVVTADTTIRTISQHRGKVYYHQKDGKLYEIGGQEPLLSQVIQYYHTEYGILYTDDEDRLQLRNEDHEIIDLDEHVEQMELVSEDCLVYRKKHLKQVDENLFATYEMKCLDLGNIEDKEPSTLLHLGVVEENELEL